MPHYESGWSTVDGVSVYAQGWEPGEAPKAVVCLLHELGEHSGRYAHLAACVNTSGHALLACDLQGHGRSGGQRGHAPTYEHLLVDAGLLLAQAELRYPGLPRFLYGHSLGRGLAISYALRHRPALAGIVATSLTLRLAFAPPAWKLLLGRAMYRAWPTFAMANEIVPAHLTRDAAAVDVYQADPLVHRRVSARLGIGLLDAGEWALEHAGDLSVPLLLMHGGADRICSLDASRLFAERAPACCTLKLWDGLYHEIHNERSRDQVFGFLLAWLERQP